MPKNKSHGLYSCPTQILKCSSNLISGILADILNTSISGVLEFITLTNIEAKNGKDYSDFQIRWWYNVNNYRPIALLSTFNGIFKKILFKRIESFIEQKNLLTPSQYGFRKAHSTQHATQILWMQYRQIWTTIYSHAGFSLIWKRLLIL